MHKIDSIVERKDWDYYTIDQYNVNVNKISGCTKNEKEDNGFNQIRLNSSGVVEIKYLENWGGICNDDFTVKEGDVLCRQFGFDLGVANIGESSDVTYTRPMHLIGLSCQGSESNVSPRAIFFQDNKHVFENDFKK